MHAFSNESVFKSPLQINILSQPIKNVEFNLALTTMQSVRGAEALGLLDELIISPFETDSGNKKTID